MCTFAQMRHLDISYVSTFFFFDPVLVTSALITLITVNLSLSCHFVFSSVSQLSL